MGERVTDLTGFVDEEELNQPIQVAQKPKKIVTDLTGFVDETPQIKTSTLTPGIKPETVPLQEGKIIGEKPRTTPEGKPIVEVSPLSPFQRAKLSFGNLKGRKEWLENYFGKDNVKALGPTEFVVKKNDRWFAIDPKLDPVDTRGEIRPERLIDIIGDISDAIGDLPEYVGFGVGQALPVGKTLSLLAPTVLSTAGRGIKDVVGAFMGVYKPESTGEVAKELGQTALESGVSHATLGAFSGVGKLVNYLAKTTPKAVYSFISPSARKRLFEKGASKVLTPEKFDPAFMTDLSKRASTGLNQIVEESTNEFAKIIDNAVEKNPNLTVDLKPTVRNFYNTMREQGFLNENNQLTALAKISLEQANKITGIIRYLDTLPKREIPIQDALKLKTQIYSLSQHLPPNQSWIVGKMYDNLRRSMVESLPQLAEANKKYSTVKAYQNILGRKWNIKNADKFEVDSLPVNQLKNALKVDSQESRILKKFDNLLPKDKKFYEDFKDALVADEFQQKVGFFDFLRREAAKQLAIGIDKSRRSAVGKGVSALYKPLQSNIFKQGIGVSMKYGVPPFVKYNIQETEEENANNSE